MTSVATGIWEARKDRRALLRRTTGALLDRRESTRRVADHVRFKRELARGVQVPFLSQRYRIQGVTKVRAVSSEESSEYQQEWNYISAKNHENQRSDR